MKPEDFAAMSVKDHEELFRGYNTAYHINKQGGFTESALLSAEQMLDVVSFGKISRKRLMEIDQQVQRDVSLTKDTLKNFLKERQSIT